MCQVCPHMCRFHEAPGQVSWIVSGVSWCVLKCVRCVLKGVRCVFKFVVFMGLLGQVCLVCLERCRFYEALGAGVS